MVLLGGMVFSSRWNIVAGLDKHLAFPCIVWQHTHGAVPSPLLKAFTTWRSLRKVQAARKILEECLKEEKESKKGRGEQKQTHKKTLAGIGGVTGM